MRILVLAALALSLSGCLATYDLPESYRPLKQIKESIRPGSWVTTVGDTVYVRNLDDWLAKRPPGGPMFDAIMLHEQLHARRQFAYGVKEWIGRYLIDVDFMRDEELRGWYLQLREYQRRGLRTHVEGVAKILSSYRNFAGTMMSYEDALTWVRDVLAGRWKPAEEN